MKQVWWNCSIDSKNRVPVHPAQGDENYRCQNHFGMDDWGKWCERQTCLPLENNYSSNELTGLFHVWNTAYRRMLSCAACRYSPIAEQQKGELKARLSGAKGAKEQACRNAVRVRMFALYGNHDQRSDRVGAADRP
jgi:hypothetical protein